MVELFPMFNLKRWDRMHPLFWIIVIAIVSVVLGSVFPMLSFLVGAGILILLLFVLYVIVWFLVRFKIF